MTASCDRLLLDHLSESHLVLGGDSLLLGWGFVFNTPLWCCGGLSNQFCIKPSGLSSTNMLHELWYTDIGILGYNLHTLFPINLNQTRPSHQTRPLRTEEMRWEARRSLFLGSYYCLWLWCCGRQDSRLLFLFYDITSTPNFTDDALYPPDLDPFLICFANLLKWKWKGKVDSIPVDSILRFFDFDVFFK